MFAGSLIKHNPTGLTYLFTDDYPIISININTIFMSNHCNHGHVCAYVHNHVQLKLIHVTVEDKKLSLCWIKIGLPRD